MLQASRCLPALQCADMLSYSVHSAAMRHAKLEGTRPSLWHSTCHLPRTLMPPHATYHAHSCHHMPLTTHTQSCLCRPGVSQPHCVRPSLDCTMLQVSHQDRGGTTWHQRPVAFTACLHAGAAGMHVCNAGATHTRERTSRRVAVCPRRLQAVMRGFMSSNELTLGST